MHSNVIDEQSKHGESTIKNQNNAWIQHAIRESKMITCLHQNAIQNISNSYPKESTKSTQKPQENHSKNHHFGQSKPPFQKWVYMYED